MINTAESSRELLGLEKVNHVDHVAIAVASPESIRSWSKGEVKNPETINYRTFKPEKGGLFCERIFGPVKDWECSCGKYKRIKHRGVVCDRCGVEVTQARVRRERMGHIELAVPVTHIWFFKCMPSRIGLVLDVTARNLERVIYYEDYLVVDPGDTPLEKNQLLTEMEFRDARDTYGPDAFVAKMGAEAVHDAAALIDLEAGVDQLQQAMTETRSKQIRKKLAKRIKVYQGFIKSKSRPEWMVLTVLPVIPPDLRPLVPLEGGRFATSDLNDLYRRVINRNNRLKNLLALKTPEVIIRNEKRMLQEAVDALFDNGRHGRAVTGAGNRALKSLSDMLKGKSGRFRQNLLGKRVDYSGRSVIVIGPDLKLHQCGLPKKMALVLFEPFIIRRLKELGYVHTVRSAKKLIERQTIEVWDVLEEVTKEHPVLLNRAPTLHRLSIQAFEPTLIEGEAIRLHPLTCSAYNADFDGDQMAVHVPLSVEAQMEARLLMMAPNNLFSPSSGKPIITPSQDIVLGCYYLTAEPRGVVRKKQKHISLFGSKEEVLFAFEDGALHIHDVVRMANPDIGMETPYGDPTNKIIETTVGRVVFSEIWPNEIGFPNIVVNKGALGDVIWNCYRHCGHEETVKVLDELKKLGFAEATKAGISMGFEDMIIPGEKAKEIQKAHKQIEDVDKQYRRGVITPGERYNKVIDIWTHCTDQIADVMLKVLDHNGGSDEFNPVWLMVDSGARGNRQQVRQLSGLRGLMAKPSGDIIEKPILANFREGLTVLDYFISTHGARKGLADTALKTADSGYLTRKLVDVAQDLIISQVDCGTTNGIWRQAIYEGEDEVVKLKDRLVGRTAVEDIANPINPEEFLCESGQVIDEAHAKSIDDAGVDRVRIRSVLTCESKRGVCQKCYGINLATGNLAAMGEAVGIIAAQSIGEPGTQLTMRTFHIGGTASSVFKQPQIEARNAGVLKYQDLRKVELEDGNNIILNKNGMVFVIDEKTGDELESYNVVIGSVITIPDGGKVKKGEVFVQWDPYNVPIISEKPGTIKFHDIIEGVTIKQEMDEATGQLSLVVIDYKEDLHPQVIVANSKGEPIANYPIPSGAHIVVEEGDTIVAGSLIAKTPRKAAKTKDITGGLPRVAELFEARKPKDGSEISRIDGEVDFGPTVRGKRSIIIRDVESEEEEEHLIPIGKHVIVFKGDKVKKGQQLTEGPVDPHEILDVCGPKELQDHLVNEVQEVYRLQGVTINDKHIEIIARQMMRKVRITETGDTSFLWGEQIEKLTFEGENEEVEKMGGQPAEGQPVLLGITKASLETDSFLSAASFQDTTRVLTDAATLGKVDPLKGFKENVIMGHIVPAGTGSDLHRSAKLKPLVEEVAAPEVEEEEQEEPIFDNPLLG
ncbi:MAG: DNA-directed RNA polymerase subunit beta' [Limisphaerales bacterium]